MGDSKRIDISLLDDNLRELINSSSKIFPVFWDLIASNTNPNNYEYVNVMTVGPYKNHIYTWDVDHWVLIGADDNSVDWGDVVNKPTNFTPTSHTHVAADVTGLDVIYATHGEVSAGLGGKANISHTHVVADLTDNVLLARVTDLTSKVDKVTGKQLSTNDFTDLLRARLTALSDTASVSFDTVYDELTAHEADTDLHVSPTEKTNIDNVPNKADTSYVNTQLSAKADASVVSTHTGNAGIHVTTSDKTSWNGHVGDGTIHVTGSQKIAWDATVIDVSNVQPTVNMWYKVVG